MLQREENRTSLHVMLKFPSGTCTFVCSQAKEMSPEYGYRQEAKNLDYRHELPHFEHTSAK